MKTRSLHLPTHQAYTQKNTHFRMAFGGAYKNWNMANKKGRQRRSFKDTGRDRFIRVHRADDCRKDGKVFSYFLLSIKRRVSDFASEHPQR